MVDFISVINKGNYMNKIIDKKLIKFLTAANFDKHIVNQLLNEFRVDDDKFKNAILKFLKNGKSFQHKEDPRQLEFDFLNDNRVSKNDSDTNDAALDGQAHDFQNAIRLINAIFINFGPLDFINGEGLSDDIRFLFKIVFEEVTEEEIRDYKINLNLKENGENNDK